MVTLSRVRAGAKQNRPRARRPEKVGFVWIPSILATMKCFQDFAPVASGCALLLAALAVLATTNAQGAVEIREESITIPTYLAGPPDPNPMFYFGRNSQGAKGRVYPYPLYDSLTDIKSNKTYRIVYLENEYVRIGILPEIGGRVFEAVDKSNGYNWVYRQHVIKPALIGLIGAWISGGVEWNIPHHHRATTFLPVQYRTQENPDGSKTVWVGELELRHRMRWAIGYTLSPGKSYLTAKVRILNRTPVVQTMLCFANLAVRVNKDYQVIFPPDTQLVTYHAKREFAAWPIAAGHYAGADFGQGTDVSWYSNHFAANSMFAWNYQDDFFAGYDHGVEAGTMSVSDHHIVPGKKFWTWGNGPLGRMWEKILTDSDGPYIELMGGAYSDNQPDYSWLQPFETKSFEMHWYPFRDIGGVKNANLDAAVNLDVGTNGLAKLGFCTTASYPQATALLTLANQVLLKETIAIDPGKPFVKEVSLPAGIDKHLLHASLSANGKELVGYSPVRLEPQPTPEPVKAPPALKDIKTTEELYLTGRRIEQFHDPSREPEPYWEEALRRDPGAARVNTALGIRELKQAKFGEAEEHFRKALRRLTADYTTPEEGEPFYYLGVALQAEGRPGEAFDAFYKATWSEAWRAPAYFSLAEITTGRADYAAALALLDCSLEANGLNLRALSLKAGVLRHLGRRGEAVALLQFAEEKTDPLDVGLLSERWLAGDSNAGNELTTTLRQFPATGLETAVEYGDAGLWQDGIKILKLMADASADSSHVSPLAYYYLGEFAARLGDSAEAMQYRKLAEQMPGDYCFPFQWEAIPALREAMKANPDDAQARYYLGNLLFDWQPKAAVGLWEESAAIDPSSAIVHRNLAIAYAHRETTNDVVQAISELEKAVSLPHKYAMHFADLDELYAMTGAPPEKRLALLEQNQPLVVKRDDALSREIGLKVFAGQYDEAIRLMTGRRFSVWEGGTLKVTEHWCNAHLLRGQQRLAARDWAGALADFQAAEHLPDNLPSEGRNGRLEEIQYWSGLSYERMGQSAKATALWEQAAASLGEQPGGRGSPRGTLISMQTVQQYYRGLAQRKLGKKAEAQSEFQDLVKVANSALAVEKEQPAGAQALRAWLDRAALAHFVCGLGHLGLGGTEEARRQFSLALECSPDDLGAKVMLARLQ